MAKRKYTAGLHFVVSTPAKTLDLHDRKAIRSHATRAGAPRRQAIQLHSWISPERKLKLPKDTILEEAPPRESNISVPVPVSYPMRVGTDFVGLQLPSGIEPHMIQDLVKLIDINKHGVYPYEICLDVHPVERGWFPYMISDACCLHSMMFSLRVFAEGGSQNQLSRFARFHYGQTLHLLQSQINEVDQTSAISDATIMVVITLAGAAELTGDLLAVANHIKGLQKIVGMRGGVRALTSHNNLQVKVCRADLGYALLFGRRPRLLTDGISWDCFIADRGLVQCSHHPYDENVRGFLATTVDRRLHNALRDLHTFSCFSNVAYQTTRKISPVTYNEMMISILYRLTHLSFKSDPTQEVIRIGLLVFSTSLFMQRHFMGQPYAHLWNLYSNALERLQNSTQIHLPVSILLWLMMLPHVVAHKEPSLADLRNVWLDNAISCTGVDSWSQAREILRSMAWVDFIHDRRGKQAFGAAIVRLEGLSPPNDLCGVSTIIKST